MNKLLVIVGPTGTGKSNIALKLAKKFDGEIVSADSRQIYTGMDVGTGKETELKDQSSKGKTSIQKSKGKWIIDGIPVYLYDLIKPDESFSLAKFQQLALEKIRDIQKRNKLPILVGGTGLYIQAITEGLKIPKAAPDFKLREELEQIPLDSLLEELQKVDPVTYEKIDKNNSRRVVRAIEVFRQTGEPFSSLREKYSVDFDILKIGLTADRDPLYKKVDERVEEWFENGFEAEVKQLVKTYPLSLPSMSSIGYRQVASLFEENITKTEAIQRIKFDLHGYIRRQLTWFKRDRTIVWFDIFAKNVEADVVEEVRSWTNASG